MYFIYIQAVTESAACIHVYQRQDTQFFFLLTYDFNHGNIYTVL